MLTSSCRSSWAARSRRWRPASPSPAARCNPRPRRAPHGTTIRLPVGHPDFAAVAVRQRIHDAGLNVGSFKGPQSPADANRELSSTGLACIGPQPARRGGAAHGGMPDGPVACPRRRGFRAADPAYGRATRPGRSGCPPARRWSRRSPSIRITLASPNSAPSPRGGSASAPSPNRCAQPSSRTSSGARPASGATPGILPDRAPQPGAQLQPPLRDCVESSAAGAPARGQGETGFHPARRADRIAAEVAVAPPPAAPSDRHSCRPGRTLAAAPVLGATFGRHRRVRRRQDQALGRDRAVRLLGAWPARANHSSGKPKGSNRASGAFPSRADRLRGGNPNAHRADCAVD